MKKLFLILSILFVSCEVNNVNYTTPLVVTYEAENVLINSASLGGIVLNEGGTNVLERGVVWSTTSPPTINNTKVVLGDRIGEFFNTYTAFQSGTKYYYAAYAINGVGVQYGDVLEFTTGQDIPCNPTVDNFVNLGTSQIDINDVEINHPGWAFDEGNIEFVTSTWNSTARITIQFNENNSQFPLTGEYTVVAGDFGNNEELSTGKAKLFITDYGWGGAGGATADPGTKFYVKNENNVMTVIFCNTHVGDTYVLNGKFNVDVP